MDYTIDRTNMRNTLAKLKGELRSTYRKFRQADDAMHEYYRGILLPMEREQGKYTDEQFDEMYSKYDELCAEREMLQDEADTYETVIQHLTEALNLIEFW